MRRELFELCVNHMHTNPMHIDDQFIGTIIKSSNSSYSFNKVRSKTRNGNKVIILILESPHIEEFLPHNLCPLANDEVFEKNADRAFAKSVSLQALSNGTYDVYLMNAIQVQCSLGVDTKYFRDLVFLYLWDDYKSDFSSRLESMIAHRKVGAVINLVTIGGHSKLKNMTNLAWIQEIPHSMGKKFINHLNKHCFNLPQNASSLRQIVGIEINNVLRKADGNIIFTDGKHPSGWYAKDPLIN